jgi:hypothetical protein
MLKDKYIIELEKALALAQEALEQERRERHDPCILPRHVLAHELANLRPKKVTDWWLAANGFS